MTPPKLMQARLTDKIKFNDKYTQYYFELVEPHRLSFVAGQYVSLQVADRGDRRPYSIVNSPTKEHGFELLVDLEPNGLGCQFLDNLPLGGVANILAPLGVFTISQQSAEQAVVFVATGAGIAPFRSMLLDQLQERRDARQHILYWGLRFAEQLFWEDEFSELEQAFPNFQFHPTISRATSDWLLCRGRVTDCLRVHELPPNAGYYLCGSDQMIDDVSQVLIQRGVVPEFIHHEKFY